MKVAEEIFSAAFILFFYFPMQKLLSCKVITRDLRPLSFTDETVACLACNEVEMLKNGWSG